MDGRSSVRAVALAALAAMAAACGKGDTVVAPRLEATCAARPAAGSAPLLVSFTLAVAGAEGPFQVAVSYGDGATGTDPDRPHTFVGAGAYTTAFTVSTATQSARCAVAIVVAAPVIVTVPVPIVNTPPVAFFQTTPAAGPGDQIAGRAPLSVRFNMCGSSDADRDPLRWTMDFQGDGTLEVDGTTGADCRRDTVYATGTYRPRICVTDLGEDRQPLHPFQCKVYTVTATP
jgi:PKD repeat protein